MENRPHSTSSVQACQNCKKDFTIEQEDFNFYEKIKVPAPTWCGLCRIERRISCTNAFSLFWRNCDKCGNRTLSMYTPSQTMTVYCQPCWWKDDWDGTEYGIEYDPSRTFIEQMNDLAAKTPYSALETAHLTLKNCDYTNAIAYSKNCTLAIWADFCENVYASSILNDVKDTADSLMIFNSELCYEAIATNKSYRTFYSQECESCTDVWFSRNCYSSMNCVGCVNLRGASYQIFNVQYSKEEYFEKIKELHLDTRTGIKSLRQKAETFWQEFPHRMYAGNGLNLNVSGQYLYESQNAKDMYICGGAENSNWCQFITFKPVKDSMDYSGWGNNAELIYECASVGENVSNTKFSAYCFPDVVNTEYSMFCIASKNNFGCINLKRKQYCILNKEYSKDEYEILKGKIIEDMKNNPFIDEKGRMWAYGEFPQPVFSRFAYNNSNASKFFPKTRDEAVKVGYEWNDDRDKQIEATKKGQDLPERIQEVDESILKEVIACTTCDRRYKIASIEYDLLRKMNIPLPDSCLKCRESSRFSKLEKPGLYDRNCIKCDNTIKTSFSKDRKEIVYCDRCYQQEFA